MALFVNACFLVLLNFEMILLLVASYDIGIEISNGVSDANLVPLAKYSFVVLVNLTIKKTYCTGALVSRRFVLTAAHCVTEETDTSARVYRGNVGDVFIKKVRNNTNSTTDTGYEERQSVAIIQPWLYEISENTFDIALIEVDKDFEGHDFVKTPFLIPFIQPYITLKCKAVGYDVNPMLVAPYSTSSKRNITMMLQEETMLVEKQCAKKHNADKTCSGISWIVQQGKQHIDLTFANSAALLMCNGSPTSKTSLNGIAIGKIDVSSSGRGNRTEYPLAFTDICPYLSWIRSHAGPIVIRSPGHYGKGCFLSGSSNRNRTKSRMAWLVVIVCILLYL